MMTELVQIRFERWAGQAGLDLKRQNGATTGDLYLSLETKWAWIGYQSALLDEEMMGDSVSAHGAVNPVEPGSVGSPQPYSGDD
jgi:hypothetical protein